MFRRFSAAESVLALPAIEFCELVLHEAAEIRDERLRAEYVQYLPFMSLGYLKPMTWAEYKDRSTGANVDLRKTDEILEELKELHGGHLDGFV